MSSARHVTNFVEDVAPPEIKAFTLDLDANTVSLTFSEAILIDSLDLTKLQFVSSRDGVIIRELNGGLVHPISFAAASSITFTLLQDDLTFLEVTDAIATDISTTYIAALPNLAMDSNGVSSNAIALADAINVDDLILDESSPEVIEFSLNLDNSEMELYFNDAVDSSSFDVGAITFQNELFRQPLQWHTFSSLSSNNSLDDGFFVVVWLGEDDLNCVKQIRSLATSEANTYLTVTAMVVDDPFGEDAVAITDGKAIQVSNFTNDETPPVLNSWSFDVDSGQFILTFSKTVDILNFQASEVTILNEAMVTRTHLQVLHLSYLLMQLIYLLLN